MKAKINFHGLGEQHVQLIGPYAHTKPDCLLSNNKFRNKRKKLIELGKNGPAQSIFDAN
jgi:hypothetical protein